jgi:hypothetical protein
LRNMFMAKCETLTNLLKKFSKVNCTIVNFIIFIFTLIKNSNMSNGLLIYLDSPVLSFKTSLNDFDHLMNQKLIMLYLFYMILEKIENKTKLKAQ